MTHNYGILPYYSRDPDEVLPKVYTSIWLLSYTFQSLWYTPEMHLSLAAIKQPV